MQRQVVGEGHARAFTAELDQSLFRETKASRATGRALDSRNFFSVDGLVIIVEYFGRSECWLGTSRIDAKRSDDHCLTINDPFPLISRARITSDYLVGGQILTALVEVRQVQRLRAHHYIMFTLRDGERAWNDDVFSDPFPLPTGGQCSCRVSRRLPMNLKHGAQTLRISLVDAILDRVICYIDCGFTVDDAAPPAPPAPPALPAPPAPRSATAKDRAIAIKA